MTVSAEFLIFSIHLVYFSSAISVIFSTYAFGVFNSAFSAFSSSNPVCGIASSSASDTFDAASETAFETAFETAPSGTFAGTTSNAASNAASNATSNATFNGTSNVASNGASNAVSCAVSGTLSHDDVPFDAFTTSVEFTVSTISPTGFVLSTPKIL